VAVARRTHKEVRHVSATEPYHKEIIMKTGAEIRERALPENYWRRARLGDRVYDVADERHIGRLEAIHHSSTATVRWEETGWLSIDVVLRDLRKAGDES
jgi:hypothetical protein